jgi:hypothetical protein
LGYSGYRVIGFERKKLKEHKEHNNTIGLLELLSYWVNKIDKKLSAKCKMKNEKLEVNGVNE